MEKNKIIKRSEDSAKRVVKSLTGKLFDYVTAGLIHSYDISYADKHLTVYVWLRVDLGSGRHIYRRWQATYTDFSSEEGWKSINAIEDEALEYAANAEQIIANELATIEAVQQKIERLEAENARLEVENEQLKKVAAL